MAHKSLWFQGRSPYVVPKCDGRMIPTCPKSERIAGEYNRGYFTLTNVLNPTYSYDDYGMETPLKQELAEVKVGDYVWMLLVPPMHVITGYFAYNDTTYTEGSDLSTMGGISLTLVSAKFSASDADGNCPIMEPETPHAGLVFPETPNPQKQVAYTYTTEVTPVGVWKGVGFKVDALPENKTLADIVGRIVIGCHVMDLDAQSFM